MKDKTVVRSITVVLILLALWMLWGNLSIAVTSYHIASPKLPDSFDGMKIAQISDLHNAEFGEDNRHLLAKLEKAEPDIIVITGDVIDDNHTDEELVLRFIGQAMQIAPCYYITGNHEAILSGELLNVLLKQMKTLGVRILRDSACYIERDGEVIQLCGVDDISFSLEGDIENPVYPDEAFGDPRCFRIMLSHRPQNFEYFVSAGVDLVLSGHMHGGQFRLPFVGGLIGSGSELFPEYDAGIFTENGTLMIVSRGLGNSVCPIRFNNRPELVITVLHCK